MLNSENIIPLSENYIALWHFPIALQTGLSSNFWHSLSQEERKKTHSFHFIQDQSRYMFCRGLLRELISLYTGLLPNEIIFSANDFGKPYLVNNMKSSSLSFNLSHTSDHVIFAFGLNTELGIDLEKLIPFPECLQIANTFFSMQEYLYLHQLKKDEQSKAFFEMWTKKEALLKVLGIGLGGSGVEMMKKINVNQGNYISLPSNDSNQSFCYLHELNFSPNYVGAVSYTGHERKIEYYS